MKPKKEYIKKKTFLTMRKRNVFKLVFRLIKILDEKPVIGRNTHKNLQAIQQRDKIKKLK